MRLLTPLLCLAVMAMIALTTPNIYADNDLQPAPDVPSANTPVILEVLPEIPTDVSLIAPIGEYKALADVTTAAICKHRSGVKVHTRVRPGCNHRTKTRLLVAYAGAKPVTFAFHSNCSVNSQFTVSAEPTLAATESQPGDEPAEIPKDRVPEWANSVCAYWTLLNHGWTDQAAVPPREYKIREISNRLDVTYDVKEVARYNEAVARRATLRRVNIAAR